MFKRLLFCLILLLTACSNSVEQKPIVEETLVEAAVDKQQSDEVFIPLAPLTETDLEDYKKTLSKMLGVESVNVTVDQIENTTLLMEKDIRKAFPEVNASDHLQSMCGNSIMGGAMQMVFTAPIDDKRVTVKSVSCNPEDGGVLCWPLRVEERYYYEEPGIKFVLNNNVQYEEAINLIEIYKNRGIDDIDEWYKGFTYEQIFSIGKTEKGYRIFLGDLYCGHCIAELIVEHDKENNRLKLIEIVSGMCV